MNDNIALPTENDYQQALEILIDLAFDRLECGDIEGMDLVMKPLDCLERFRDFYLPGR